ncbi:MAG: hypothetical protein J6D01_03685 [Muribaculaceae bacterium]|nr:hypothetical protein [Muribaculaceae bacterium]
MSIKQIVSFILAIASANIMAYSEARCGYGQSQSITQSYANNEPGTNVGKSLAALRQAFPNLTYTKSDNFGDHYYDGEDPSEGITCMFTVKGNKVVEECMMVQDTNGFPLTWWRSVCDKFYNDHAYKDVVPKAGHYKFYYSYFTIDVIYIEEGRQNTAMVVYKLL